MALTLHYCIWAHSNHGMTFAPALAHVTSSPTHQATAQAAPTSSVVVAFGYEMVAPLA